MSPARYMTHGDSMLKLRDRLAKEEEEDRKKEQRPVGKERKKAAKLA